MEPGQLNPSIQPLEQGNGCPDVEGVLYWRPVEPIPASFVGSISHLQ